MNHVFTENRSRRYFLYLSLGYVVFVAYGSLVPLEYKDIPFSLALDLFLAKSVTRVSSADWVANVLLGIPLAYFFSGYLWRRRTGLYSVFVATFIFMVCYCISWSIEFSQMFFSSRTASKSDIWAQNIGAVIGLSAWWITGRSVLTWIQQWRRIKDVPNLSEQLLKAYLVILVFYNVLPLDLTISPVEIFHKWREGRVKFVPFSSAYEGPIELFYELTTDAIIWVPVAILLVTSGKRTILQAWIGTVFCAVGLEVLQLFVYSRVTDLTDVITGIIGATAGVFAGRLMYYPDGRASPHTAPTGNFKPFIWSGILFIIYSLALFAIFWYPYELITDTGLIIHKAKRISWIPLKAYYRGTEFRAITEVFHKMAFFIPLGMVLSYALVCLEKTLWYRLAFWAGVFLICGVALTVEVGQLFFMEKITDITDFALEAIGGILGLKYSLKFYKRVKREA